MLAPTAAVRQVPESVGTEHTLQLSSILQDVEAHRDVNPEVIDGGQRDPITTARVTLLERRPVDTSQ